jgi:5-methylcytosine-specific restriction endonuclease McrBC GTP-binding regulatory subunit McrB
MKFQKALEVYDLYNRFIDEFIIHGKSILTKDKIECLNDITIANCQRVYVEGADFSKDKSFGEKLKTQFENEDYPTRLLMAHVEWLWALATINIKLETKRTLTERTLGNKLILNELEDVYAVGIGHCGTFHQRSKNKEIEFILLLIKLLYHQRINGEIFEIKDVVHTIENICLVKKNEFIEKDNEFNDVISFKGGQAMRNILLHLGNPIFYERIFSHGSKQTIVSTFANLIDDDNEDIDTKIHQIRQKLAIELKNPNFDFYDESVKKLWDKSDKTTSSDPSVLDTNSNKNDKKNMSNFPLNQILYGPPGTGKTYHTINKALAIIEKKSEIELEFEEREDLKKRFDGYVEAGQIVFTTFHQSMSYEDFIEGIKPIEPQNEGENMVYRIVDGIFKRISIDAAFAIAQQKKPKNSEKIIDFSMQYDNYIGKLEEQLLEGKIVKVNTKSNAEMLIDAISANQNIIVKHLEGKRTYTISKSRLTKLNQAFSELENINNIDTQFRNVIGGSNASGYWAILNAIRKTPFNEIEKNEINKIYSYEEKNDVVSAMSKADYSFSITDKIPKPYVLIIDEINRGNVSQIFGELITLIEEDKRLGCEEDLKVTLPYSKDKFGVPSNVFIIGTMNTADRSVEALDTALRRRFSFIEMPPEPELIATDGALKADYGVIDGINLVELLRTINKRIEKLLNKDNLIGHSYFMSVRDLDELKAVFQNKIMPLLQEYFFGDYGKIGLVLGSSFVKKEEVENNIFSDFDYDNGSSDFENRTIYRLINANEMDDKTFNEAIKSLINSKK